MKKWKDLKGNILTGGWVSPPHEKITGENYITNEQYRTISECGIDVLFTMYENPTVYGQDKIRTALELADKHNIGLFVCDYRIGNSVDPVERDKLLAFYGQYESFVGINLYDEPGIARFSQLEEQRQRIQEKHPDCLCFINLLPMYAYATILKGTYKVGDEAVATYEEYVEYMDAFTHTYNAELLSYDFYPFRFAYGIFDENYFKQMSLVRRYAEQSNLPFWTFIQVTSWNPEIRIVEDAEIHWQVHTSLAYGARGIMYFTYWEPAASSAEYYKGAIISANGERGQSYKTVQTLNRYINRIGKTLAASDFCGVVVPKNYDGMIPQEDRVALPGNVSISEDENLFIGIFKANEKQLLYVVNTSLETARDVRIAVQDAKSVQLYAVEQENVQIFKQRSLFHLCAGEGALIVINE